MPFAPNLTNEQTQDWNGKMNEKDETELHQQAMATAQALREVMKALVREHGFAPEAVVAGCHAEAAAAMVVSLGGIEAAERMRAAADQVSPLPSLGDVKLAECEPAGCA